MKPENIYTSNIALCNFGLSKLNIKNSDKTNTCGMPEYLASKILCGQGYIKMIDWWTLGVLLMLSGLLPFYDSAYACSSG